MKLFGLEINVSRSGATAQPVVPATDAGGSGTPSTSADNTTEKRSGGVGVKIPYYSHALTGGVQKASITTANGTSSVLAISTVYACVKILADQMASLPLLLNKLQEEDYYRPYRNHPAYRLFRRPNKYQTGFDFRRALFASAYLFGNGIAYVKRDGAGRPVEAHVVAPGNVSVGDYDGQLWYVIRPLSPAGQLMEQIILPATDVIHIKALNLDCTGIDIIQAHAGTFGLATAAQNYANQYFTNGAAFSGVVEHPLQLKDDGLKNLTAAIKEQQTSQGSVLVLEEGAKYNKLNDTMVNSGVVDVRKYNSVDIARIYSVPMFLLGENSGTTFSNMYELNRTFSQTALVPMCEQAEAQYDLVLLSERDFNAESLYFEHDFSNMLRGDMKAQAEIVRMMLTNGVMRRNEVRDWQRMARDPNLNDYLTPLNMNAGDGNLETDPKPQEAKSE